MAKADDDFLATDALTDIGFGLVRIVVTLLNFEGDFVGAAVLGPAQGANATGNAGVEVRTRAGDHAGCKGRGVELMLGVQHQRGVHGAHPGFARCLAVQQVQEMSADGVVIGFDIDDLAVDGILIPVHQHRAEAGDQPVGDVAGIGVVVVFLLRQYAAQHRHARAHHVHRVRVGRQFFQCALHGGGQAAIGLELGLVGAQLRFRRQLAVDEQVGDFLELAGFRDIQNVVAAVVQVVAAAAHGAKGGVAGGGAGQRHGFLRLESASALVRLTHRCSPVSSIV